MDINKTLIAYGKLKIKEKEVNLKIKKAVKYAKSETDIQLFRYFDYWKEARRVQQDCDEDPYELEDWGSELDTDILPETYALFDLIKERKSLRVDIRYKKMAITKYAIKLSKGNQDESSN